MIGKFDLNNGTMKSGKQLLFEQFRIEGEPETGYGLVSIRPLSKGTILGLLNGDLLHKDELITRNNSYLMQGLHLMPRVVNMECVADGKVWMDCTKSAVCYIFESILYSLKYFGLL